MKPLYITHIDNGAAVDDDASLILDYGVIDDPCTGRWPKVSFSNGKTYSYVYLTNTKVLFFTGLNKAVFTDREYETLVKQFMDSDEPFCESNWCAQVKRVNEWKPIMLEAREQLVA